MAVPNLIKVVLHYAGYGEEGTISWHLAPVTSAHSNSDLHAALSQTVSHWQTEDTPSARTNICQLLTTQQTFDKVDAYQYNTSDGPATSQASVTLSGWGGTSENMQGPLQTSLVCSLRTATPGARGRGRQYYPAYVFAPQVSNALISAGSADFIGATAAQMGTTLRDQFRSSLSDDGIRWVVFSRAAGLAHEVTTLLVDNKLDTQRRREQSLLPNHVGNFDAVAV